MIHISVPKVEITEEEAIDILLRQAYFNNSYYEEELRKSKNENYKDLLELDKPNPTWALERRNTIYELLFALEPEYRDEEKLQEAFKNIKE